MQQINSEIIKVTHSGNYDKLIVSVNGVQYPLKVAVVPGEAIRNQGDNIEVYFIKKILSPVAISSAF